jgi:hypothetical protein
LNFQLVQEGEAMRGEKVIVRAFDGEPLVRLIWEVSPKAVYICSEEGYQRLLAGEPWIPIGFPKNDVFQYDPVIAERLKQIRRDDPAMWENVPPWEESVQLKNEGY